MGIFRDARDGPKQTPPIFPDAEGTFRGSVVGTRW